MLLFHYTLGRVAHHENGTVRTMTPTPGGREYFRWTSEYMEIIVIIIRERHLCTGRVFLALFPNNYLFHVSSPTHFPKHRIASRGTRGGLSLHIAGTIVFGEAQPLANTSASPRQMRGRINFANVVGGRGSHNISLYGKRWFGINETAQ